MPSARVPAAMTPEQQQDSLDALNRPQQTAHHVVGAGSLEFAVDWARNRPIPSAAPSRIVFPGESLEGLDAVADQLKSQAQTKGVSVEGFVIRLGRTDQVGPGQIVVLQDDEVKRCCRRFGSVLLSMTLEHRSG